MKFDPEKHHRRSIRIPDYDYSQNGLYFITICSYEQKCLFGKIKIISPDNYICDLNDSGIIASNEWQKTEQIRSNIKLHAFVFMPNHMHGIIEICDHLTNKTKDSIDNKSTKNSISFIIRGYKAAVSKQINLLRNLPDKPVWQRNYYEHIIRNENSFVKISEYIQTNPLRWQIDKYYQE